jgi:uncharacterized protein YbaR (Trm112 family)
MNLAEALVDVLACPRCGGDLEAAESASDRLTKVRCRKCSATYPVRDGILDFLPPLDHKTDP